jgi:hypothetical protein
MTMPRQPWWNEPISRQVRNESASAKISQAFANRGLSHLKVVGRGVHLVVYSEDDQGKFNRVRFTRVDADRYQLGFATHRGTWEGSPFEGSLEELITLALDQFAFLLTDL